MKLSEMYIRHLGCRQFVNVKIMLANKKVRPLSPYPEEGVSCYLLYLTS